ncbi:hypothetical protein GE21DRAFT_1069606 [Neurospora crassa]|nr:hypothetical protein GE21DRAFT_1069606 [Neurospora crassa]
MDGRGARGVDREKQIDEGNRNPLLSSSLVPSIAIHHTVSQIPRSGFAPLGLQGCQVVYECEGCLQYPAKAGMKKEKRGLVPEMSWLLAFFFTALFAHSLFHVHVSISFLPYGPFFPLSSVLRRMPTKVL